MHIGFYSIHCLMAIRVRVKLSSIMGKVTIIKALVTTGYYRKFGEPITREDLEKFGNKIQRNYVVMLYTGFSRAWSTEEFLYNWPYLDRSGADYLIERKIRAVGIEALSIAGWPGKEGYPYPSRVARDDVAYVHYKLLSNGIYVIEGAANLDMALSKCKDGEGLFLFAPLKIRGAEGSPVRLLMMCESK